MIVISLIDTVELPAQVGLQNTPVTALAFGGTSAVNGIQHGTS